MRTLTVPFLALLALANAGCLDLEQEYTLNPDGSGKVVVRWVGAPMEIGAEKSAEARVAAVLKDEVTQCEGVDAWKDVSCVVRADGKFEFKGTAYFKDFARLKLHNAGVSMISLKSSKDAEGNLAVVNEPAKKERAAKDISDDAAKAQLKEERAQYQQAKRLFEAMLSDLKATAKVNLPGRVGTATNFKKTGDASVRIAVDGKTFLKVIDDLIMNDEWMIKMLKETGGNGLQDAVPTDEINEKIFGEKGPVRAVTTGPLKPLFDYESEAAVARKSWSEAAPKLGAGLAAPAAKGGDFKSLKVTGVHYVYEQDSERGLGNNRPGLTLTLLGELPGTVLGVKQGRVTKAVADSGEDLMPDKFQQTIHFPHLSKDKAAVEFDVKLGLPPAKVKSLKEVSGVLTYLVGDKTKEVDLGFDELKADAQGKGATIKKIEDSKWEEGFQNLEVRIEMPSDQVVSVVVKDATGAVLKTTDGGSWSSDSETTRTLTVKGKFPAKGKIVAVVYDNLKAFEIAFKIENIDLLGRPVK